MHTACQPHTALNLNHTTHYCGPCTPTLPHCGQLPASGQSRSFLMRAQRSRSSSSCASAAMTATMKTNVQKQVIPSALSRGLHSVTLQRREPAWGGSHDIHWPNPDIQFALSPVRPWGGFRRGSWLDARSLRYKPPALLGMSRPMRLTVRFVTSRHHRCSQCSSHAIPLCR